MIGQSSIDEKYKRMAAALAAQNSTRGMIIQRLEVLGANRESASAIAEQALANVKTRRRRFGIGNMLLGAVSICLGFAMILESFKLEPEQSGAATVGVGTIIAGALMFFRGFVHLTSGKDSVD